MHGGVCRAGSIAIAILLGTLPAAASAAGRAARFAQNVSEGSEAAAAPSQSPVAVAPVPPPANSPDQIKRAQSELRRLDCLKGRIDGKLGEQTREAVRKFWTSAKQPVVEVKITDELIAELAERGDNFCRPPRPFFAIGGRPGTNSPPPLLVGPGAKSGPMPGPIPGPTPGPQPPAAAAPR